MTTQIKILGTGCVKCQRTYEMVKEVVEELNVDAQIEKVEDLQAIMAYNVMATPAVVIDDIVFSKGGLPRRKELRKFFSK
jgi:small redox-active disulfide protein 2